MQNNLREYDYHYYSEEKSGLSQKRKVRTSPIDESNIRFDSKIEKKLKTRKKNKKMHFKYI